MDSVTEHRAQAIVDTHRHPIGPKLAARMAEGGFYDPKQPFPQTNAIAALRPSCASETTSLPLQDVRHLQGPWLFCEGRANLDR